MIDLRRVAAQADAEKDFPIRPAAVAYYLGAHLAERLKDGEQRHSIAAWRAQLADFAGYAKGQVAISRRNFASTNPGKGNQPNRQAAKQQYETELRAIEAISKQLKKQLADIEKLALADQRTKLDALYSNYAAHNYETLGEVPVSKVDVPDWQAMTGELKKASSEQTVLHVEQAFERGQFHSGPTADYPIANISGRLGGAEIRAHAELTPDESLVADGTGREIMGKLAERLRDPKLGLGPQVQAALQSLVSFYLTRRQRDNSVNVTIAELAEFMGYQKGPNGFHPDAYTSVRDAVRPLESLTVQAFNLPALKGHQLPTNLQERAFTFTYFAENDGSGARPAQRWLTLSFRPNKYYTAALTAPGSLLMGTDRRINRLNPKNERGERLLGKYLERHWRMNWDKGHGSITRSVRGLLTDGMGLDDAAAEKPSVETWQRLEDALDKLQDIGTVRNWEGNSTWAEVRERLQPENGTPRRMTQSLWNKLLGATVTVEAAGQYLEHYKHHGLVYKGGDSDPLLLELREYRARANRPDARIAEDLAISTAMLSQIINGKKKISEQIRPRIEQLIVSDATLPLPFDEPRAM